MHDVFISYEHESKHIADAICSTFERNKIRCWYAPRDVVGGMPYAKEIVEAIKTCKVFILVLNKNASESPQVGNEVEWAYRYLRDNKLKILPFKVSEDDISEDMQFYINRLHWIDAVTKPHEQHIEVLLKDAQEILGVQITGAVNQNVNKPNEREKNNYFTSDDTQEVERLAIQSSILQKFDAEVYEKIFKDENNVRVLDIGSNDGTMIMDRLSTYSPIHKLIGIEINADAVAIANSKFGDENHHFYCCDCEEKNFSEELQRIMKEASIDEFDVITISLVLLHLKNPYKVLNTLRKFLRKEGTILIRDIDDGLAFAYPDPDNTFQRVLSICNYCETTGFRHSGRQIYSLLEKAGMKDICLEKQGLNTISMSHEEREALFNACFSFIPGDAKIMVDRYPNNNEILEDYQWLISIYDDLEERFNDHDFVFQAGIMLYTAKKI